MNWIQRPKLHRGRQRFTLIELLVVVGIIAILAAMLLPALQHAKEYSKTASCIGNERQIVTAMILYADDYSGYLPNKTAWGSKPYDYYSNAWVTHVDEYAGCRVKTITDVRDTVFECPNYRKTRNLVGTSNGWIGNNYAVNPRINSSWDFAMISRINRADEIPLMGDGGIYNSVFCLCRYDQNHYSIRHNRFEKINVGFVDGHTKSMTNADYQDCRFSAY